MVNLRQELRRCELSFSPKANSYNSQGIYNLFETYKKKSAFWKV